MLGSISDLPDDGLDQTAEALESGLTALTPTAALQIIETWQSACQNQTDLDLGPVAEGLNELHGLLSGERLDGRAIGRTLASLAEATRAAMAQTDEERITPALDRLAAALGRGAQVLGS